MTRHSEMLQEFKEFAHSGGSAESLMERMAQRLHEEMARYNWVGFYLVDKKDPGVLVVGPYVGSFAPNERIPLSRGLCGAAASTGIAIVVNNVADDPRYLAGSDLVKSEMVVPIFAKNRLASELDVESYFADTFGKPDQEFVEACAALVGEYLERAKG